MEALTTITLQKKTKDELDKLKLCKDESYNSLLIRILLKERVSGEGEKCVETE